MADRSALDIDAPPGVAGGERPIFSAISCALPELNPEEINPLARLYECGPKEWHEQPFVHGFPRAKDYVEGNVGITLQFEVSEGGVKSDETIWKSGYSAALRYHFERDIIPDERGAFNFEEIGNQDQLVVFIPVIDLGHEPQNFVALFEGFEIVEEKPLNAGEGSLHRSLFDGRFHLLSGVRTREGAFFGFGVERSAQASPAAIQRGTQTEDDIASEAGVVRAERGILENGARVWVENSVGGFLVIIQQPADLMVHISDVMLGPRNLVDRAFE